jgi:hypothetical protein
MTRRRNGTSHSSHEETENAQANNHSHLDKSRMGESQKIIFSDLTAILWRCALAAMSMWENRKRFCWKTQSCWWHKKVLQQPNRWKEQSCQKTSSDSFFLPLISLLLCHHGSVKKGRKGKQIPWSEWWKVFQQTTGIEETFTSERKKFFFHFRLDFRSLKLTLRREMKRKLVQLPFSSKQQESVLQFFCSFLWEVPHYGEQLMN